MGNELTQNYARAFFGLFDPEQYDFCLEGSKALLSSVKENPEWVKFLSAYAVSKEEKYAAIERVYLAPVYDERFRNFLKVIVEHNRVNILEEILEDVLSLINEATGVKEGILFSSAPLSDAEISSIEAKFAKKLGCKVKLHAKTDHSLLGGVKVQLDGRVYDGTLRARLFELKRSLKGGSR